MGKALIGIILAVVVAAGAYFIFTGQAKAPSTSDLGLNTAPEQASATEQSLRDLIGSGISQKCTFDNAVADGASSGTSYIGDGKVRTDFTGMQAGSTVNGHVIIDGENAYMWTDGMTDGVKTSVAQQTEGTNAPGAAQSGVDVNAKVSYRCEPWTVDAGQFALPSSVTFRDLSAMMPAMQ